MWTNQETQPAAEPTRCRVFASRRNPSALVERQCETSRLLTRYYSACTERHICRKAFLFLYFSPATVSIAECLSSSHQAELVMIPRFHQTRQQGPSSTTRAACYSSLGVI